MTCVHVIPLNDISEHVRSICCGCGPWFDQGGALVHNAFDGREVIERAGIHDPGRRWLVEIHKEENR